MENDSPIPRSCLAITRHDLASRDAVRGRIHPPKPMPGVFLDSGLRALVGLGNWSQQLGNAVARAAPPLLRFLRLSLRKRAPAKPKKSPSPPSRGGGRADASARLVYSSVRRMT